MNSGQSSVKKIKIQNPRFYTYANEAAQAELRGDYVKAAVEWLKAMKQSKNRVNIVWSGHRHQFCLSVIRNGWSVTTIPEVKIN